MILVKVRGDTADILKDLTHTKKSVIVASQNRALNLTAQRVITQGRRQAAQELNVAQKFLTPKIILHRSNFNKLYALIEVLPSPLSLYRVKPLKTALKMVKSGFVATMPTGHTGIFFRKSNAKAKISPVTGKWTQLPIKEKTINVYVPLTRAFDLLMATFAPKEYRKIFAEEMKKRSRGIIKIRK